MGKIYKYKHKKKTIWSFIFVLPATLLWGAAIVHRFFEVPLAQQYLEFNLSMPQIVQVILWIFLPVWAFISAVQAYRSGTISRYRKYNTLAVLLSVITLIIFALLIISTFI